MSDCFKSLEAIGIIPVVVINDAAGAVPLARALVEGGIPTAEVTFRTEAAPAAIAAMAQQVPELLVGAGTVTSAEMARQAVDAGAKYIVSPGLNPAVVRWCLEHEVPVLPGVATPTEVEAAMELGLTMLKFFPAEQNGGVKMLKSLASPYKTIRFIPTGGVGKENLNEYLGQPNVAACGGSWICPPALVDAGDWAGITRLCREAVAEMHGFQLLHIGLNSRDEQEARANCEAFAGLFGFPVIELPGAFFAGTAMEVVKKPFLGEKGHIAISTNSVERAMAWFERRGCRFRAEGVARDEKGLIAVYFEQEVGGFALHLRRKP